MATNNTDLRYLSLEGLKTFWGKAKSYIAEQIAAEKISIGTNGEYTQLSVDDAGRVISVSETALKAKFSAIDTLDAAQNGRLDTAEGEIDTLQAAVAKLDGNVETVGSIKAQVAAALESATGYTDTELNKVKGEGYKNTTLASIEQTLATIQGGNNGSIGTQIATALDALDWEDKDSGYVSKVTQANGQITVEKTVLPTYSVADDSDFLSVASVEKADKGVAFTISTSNIAKADELATLTSEVRALDAAETGRVSVLETKVAALASATHFRGAFADHTTVTNPAEGDVVVNTTSGKEYIYSEGKWVELGDTSDEVRRIGVLEGTVYTEGTGLVDKVAALETAVGGNSVVNSIDGAKGALTLAKGSAAEGVVNFAMSGSELTASVNIGATAAQGAKADSAIQNGQGLVGAHTTTEVLKTEDNKLTVSVNVATVGADQYSAETATGIPTAGSVMKKINDAVAALNATQTDETTSKNISKIVTSVTMVGGNMEVKSSDFNAITDDEINGLFN